MNELLVDEFPHFGQVGLVNQRALTEIPLTLIGLLGQNVAFKGLFPHQFS